VLAERNVSYSRAIGKGEKYRIFESFFISFFLTPIIGFVFIFNSPNLKDKEYKQKMLERAAASAPTLSVAEELSKLNDLRKDGIISDDELTIQKDRLLNN
jgi:hypothetical protein